MDTLISPEQLITNPCSHNEGVVDVGGGNGYPSDSQTALNKLHVEHSPVIVTKLMRSLHR